MEEELEEGEERVWIRDYLFFGDVGATYLIERPAYVGVSIEGLHYAVNLDGEFEGARGARIPKQVFRMVGYSPTRRSAAFYECKDLRIRKEVGLRIFGSLKEEPACAGHAKEISENL